jgi:hypothetical protein
MCRKRESYLLEPIRDPPRQYSGEGLDEEFFDKFLILSENQSENQLIPNRPLDE